MATSGTVVFRTNRNDLIKSSLRLVGGYDIENASGPTAAQISTASEALNMLVKQWQTKGLQLWLRKYGVIFPQDEQSVFALGSPAASGDHACLTTPLGVGGFVNTELSADAAAGASTISVDTISSDFTAGISVVTIASTYNIGIELDDGALQWTTVSGAPSGTTVTLAAVLDGAASEGNKVYCYQTKLVRPLRISDAWIRHDAGNDSPVNPIPREHYNRFGQKTTVFSTPTQLYYDNQTNTGYIYVYPGFDSVDKLLYIEFQTPIQDFNSSTDDFDLPQEHNAFLKFKLAEALAPEYEVPMEKFKMIAKLAKDSEDFVDGWDQENTSVFFQPGGQ